MTKQITKQADSKKTSVGVIITGKYYNVEKELIPQIQKSLEKIIKKQFGFPRHPFDLIKVSVRRVTGDTPIKKK